MELSGLPEDFTVPSLEMKSNVDSSKLQSFVDALPPMESELQILMSQKAVTLQGLVFSLHFAGDDILKVATPNMGDQVFNRFMRALEDIMVELDEKYKQRNYAGAACWQASGTKVKPKDEDGPDRLRSSNFRMFPRSFSNAMAVIKDGLVNERLRYCTPITLYSAGRYKQVLYLLPFEMAPVMLAKIEEANREVNELNARIEEYMASSDYQQVYALLEQYHFSSVADRKTFKVPPIRYEMMPLQLNPNAIMDMVKPEDIKDAAIRKEYEVGAAKMREELIKQTQTMTKQVLSALKDELDRNVKAIVAEIKLNPENVQRNMTALKAKANSIGLEALASSVLEPLAVLYEDPSKCAELFGCAIGDLPDQVDERLAALLRSL
jgi:hypothetical protein